MAEQTTGDQPLGAGGATTGDNLPQTGGTTPNKPTGRAGQQNPGNPPAAGRINPFADITFVVEVDDGKGGRMQVNARPRSGQILRGAYDFARIGGNIVNDAIKPLATTRIPGILIAIKGVTREVVLLDPLTLPENERMLKLIQTCVKNFTGNEQNAEKTVKMPGLADDDFKGWLYWMRRALDAKQIVVHRGEVPPMARIETLPGRLRHQPFDRNAKTEFQKPEFPYMSPGQTVAGEAFEANYDNEMDAMFAGIGR